MTKVFHASTIEKICNIEYGTRVVRKKDAGTLYPVYGGGGKTFFLDTFNREDRVVIARFAMSERCTRRVFGKFALNDSGLTLSPKDTSVLRQDYLDYYILSLNDEIYDIARGTAQKNLDVTAFKQLRVVFPDSLEKQREIVEKLHHAFLRIDFLEQNLDLRNQKVNQLFKSFLSVAFTPPIHEIRPQHSSKNQGVVCAWREVPLKQICDVDWGNTKLTKSSYVANGKFLAVSAAGADGHINHYEHEANVPVLSAIGAQCGRMFYPGVRFTAIKNTITLTPKPNIVDGKFLYYLLNHVELPQRGAGQPFISKGDIEVFLVSIPDGEMAQRKIAQKLDTVFADIELLKAQIKIERDFVIALRQSILSNAVTQEQEVA